MQLLKRNIVSTPVEQDQSFFEAKYLVSRKLPTKSIEFVDTEHHLILRPYTPSDLTLFHSALQRTLPSLYKFMPWPIKPWDERDCLLWLTETMGEYYLGKIFEWGCFDKNSGDFLLSIGICPAPSWNPHCWELGYWTVTDYHKKGLATLASKIIIATAFKCFNIKRLQVGAMKANPASIRVIEKTGFLYEGELRGAFSPPTPEKIALGGIVDTTDLLYALLPEDCFSLPWYQSISKTILVESLTQEKLLLFDII